jgi:hypothetical protein
MRILGLLIAFVPILTACATLNHGPSLFSVDTPHSVSIALRARSELIQYRGADGESWLFVPIKPEFGEQRSYDLLISDKETEHRGMARIQSHSPPTDVRLIPKEFYFFSLTKLTATVAHIHTSIL